MNKIKLRRINLMDVVLLLVVVSIAVGAYISVNQRELSMLGIKTENAYIDANIFEEHNLKLSSMDLKPGDEIFIAGDKKLSGEVIAMHTIYEKMYLTDNVGGLIPVNNTNKIIGYNVIIRTSVKRDSSGAYIAGKYFISAGTKTNISTEDSKIFSVNVESVNFYK